MATWAVRPRTTNDSGCPWSSPSHRRTVVRFLFLWPRLCYGAIQIVILSYYKDTGHATECATERVRDRFSASHSYYVYACRPSLYDTRLNVYGCVFVCKTVDVSEENRNAQSRPEWLLKGAL